jgi:hypothetical protein
LAPEKTPRAIDKVANELRRGVSKSGGNRVWDARCCRDPVGSGSSPVLQAGQAGPKPAGPWCFKQVRRQSRLGPGASSRSGAKAGWALVLQAGPAPKPAGPWAAALPAAPSRPWPPSATLGCHLSLGNAGPCESRENRWNASRPRTPLAEHSMEGFGGRRSEAEPSGVGERRRRRPRIPEDGGPTRRTHSVAVKVDGLEEGEQAAELALAGTQGAQGACAPWRVSDLFGFCDKNWPPSRSL